MEHLQAFWERYRVVVIGLVVVLATGGVVAAKQMQPPPMTVNQSTEPSPEPADIAVDVEGAVAAPGVRHLPEGSLVEDALAAAGGFSDAVDAERVAKELNRADKLKPNQKIYVFRQGEQVAKIASDGKPADASGDGPINLNSASLAELDTLPGIGEVTAQKILDYREEHGSFSTIEELMEVSGIGDAKFEKLKDLVAV